MRRRVKLSLAALAAVAGCLAPLGAVPALAQEEQPPPTPTVPELDVQRVYIPETREKLAKQGVRVKASCSLDCVIVVKVRISRDVARELGLRGTLVASGAAGAKAGQPRWVVAPMTRRARRALLEQPSAGGRLDVRIRALS